MEYELPTRCIMLNVMRTSQNQTTANQIQTTS